MFLLLISAARAAPLPREPAPEHKPGELIVKLRAPRGLRAVGINAREGMLAQAANGLKTEATIDTVRPLRFVKAEVWELGDDNIDVVELAARLRKRDDVQYAEPNYVVQTCLTPNDPAFGDLWGLHNTGQSGGTADADIDAPEAWEIETGGDVVVAVIDTGVDYNHVDIAANMWRNPGETPGDGIDNDGNGYVDDVYGIDTSSDDSDPFDQHYHGTHVAGTIAAVGNNAAGAVGVCWRARIMALRFLNSQGWGYVSDAVECVEYATLMGARVMNNSWGGGGYSEAMSEAIAAANDAGVLFCAAAGNSHSNNDSSPHYPSSYTNANVLAVASSDRSDALSSFSCYGATSVDLAAPGTDIYSLLPNNSYGTKSGTSMATPHCAGAAALLLSMAPGLRVEHVKTVLMNNVDLRTAFAGKTVSGGRLNINNTLRNSGFIFFDRVAYFPGALPSISLVDSQFAGTTQQTVSVSSSHGDSEELVLYATKPGGVVFTNRMQLGVGAAISSNGLLEAVHDVELRVSYYSPLADETVTGTAMVDAGLVITITTPSHDVPYQTNTIQVSGLNNGDVHVDMVVSNEVTGETAVFATTNAWTSPPIGLSSLVAVNPIWVHGVNAYGLADSDSVRIRKLGPAGITNHVSPTGSNIWPYSSWETAATSIQAAVDVSFHHNLVLVTNGVYAESVEIDDWPVNLRSVNGPDVTIIDGGGSGRCLLATNGTVVSGFTLTNGLADYGAGAYLTGATLTDSIASGNQATNDGGGLWCGDGCLVSNCVVRGNTTRSFGGGIYLGGDSNLVARCRIVGNETSSRDGGGLVCVADSEVRNSFIAGNTTSGSARGGGVYCEVGTIRNCTVIRNSSRMGHGVVIMNGALIVNSIVYYNSADDRYGIFSDPYSYASNCCCRSRPYKSEAMVTDPPLLAGVMDPHLLAGSPCIDAGSSAAAAGWWSAALSSGTRPFVKCMATEAACPSMAARSRTARSGATGPTRPAGWPYTHFTLPCGAA